MEKLHILVVEDNQINQTILKRQMVKAGLTCEGEYSESLGIHGNRLD